MEFAKVTKTDSIPPRERFVINKRKKEQKAKAKTKSKTKSKAKPPTKAKDAPNPRKKQKTALDNSSSSSTQPTVPTIPPNPRRSGLRGVEYSYYPDQAPRRVARRPVPDENLIPIPRLPGQEDLVTSSSEHEDGPTDDDTEDEDGDGEPDVGDPTDNAVEPSKEVDDDAVSETGTLIEEDADFSADKATHVDPPNHSITRTFSLTSPTNVPHVPSSERGANNSRTASSKGGANGFTAAPSPVHANQRLPVFGSGFVPQPDVSGWWSSDHGSSSAFGPAMPPFGHPHPLDLQPQFGQQHSFGPPQATHDNLLAGVNAAELATLAAAFPSEPVFPSTSQFNPAGNEFSHGFGSSTNGVDFNGPAANTIWPTPTNNWVQYTGYANPSAPAQAFFANSTASHGAANFSGHIVGSAPSCNTPNTFASNSNNANTIAFPNTPSLASTPSSRRRASAHSGPFNSPAPVSAAATPSSHRRPSAQLGLSSTGSFTRSASMPSKPGIFSAGTAKARSSFLGHFAASPSLSSRAATPCPPLRRQSGPGHVRDQANTPPSSASPSSANGPVSLSGPGSSVAPQPFNVSRAMQSTLGSEPLRSLSVPSPHPQPVHNRVGASAPASPYIASAHSLPAPDQSLPINLHAHSLPASPFAATSNELPPDGDIPLPLEDGPDPGFNPNIMMLGVGQGPDWSGDEPTNTEQPVQEENSLPGPNALQSGSHPATLDMKNHLYVRDQPNRSIANIPTTRELAKKRIDVFRNIVDRASKRRAGDSNQTVEFTAKSKAMSAVMSTSILWDLVSVAPWSVPDDELLEKASSRACEATGYDAENISSQVRIKITESISRLRGDTIYISRPVVATCMNVSPANPEAIEALLTNDQFLYPSCEMIPNEYFLADIVGEVLAKLLFSSAKKLGLVFMEELLREDDPEILKMVLTIAGLANDDHPPKLADSSSNATIGPSLGLLAFAAISIYHSLTLIAAGDDGADKDSKEKKVRFTERLYQSMWTGYVCELAQHPRLGDVRHKALTRLQDEYCSMHPPRGKRLGADRAW